MEREAILESLKNLKSQLPVDSLDQTTIEEQAKKIDEARRIRERAERRIKELEEKLKKDENYQSPKAGLLTRSIEDNRKDLADMIVRSDRLAAELRGFDLRVIEERKRRTEAEAFNDKDLLKQLDANIKRLEKNITRREAELEALNASIQELDNFVKDQEANIGAATVEAEIEALKEADRAEISRLNLEIRNASTESMLAEFNFANSLNDLIADVERGNITDEILRTKLVEYKERIPKQFLLRDAAARSGERLQLEEALEKYEPRLAELEEKLSNDDNYRGVLAERLIAVRDAGQADLDRYTNEIKDNGARIAEINNEVRNLEVANAAAQRVIDERKAEIEALPNQRHPMKKHLEAEIARKENEITRNTTSLHSLRSEKGMLSGNIDRLRELTKPLKTELEKINKEIAEDAKKVNKSQQRLDKIERDSLLASIGATKLRLDYIEYDISETIDNIVVGLDNSIAAKEEERKRLEEEAKKEQERIAKEEAEKAKEEAKKAEEEAKKAEEEKAKEEEKAVVPAAPTFFINNGGNGVKAEIVATEDGKNFIVFYGPKNEEMMRVEIPKNVFVPDKVEEKKEEPVAAAGIVAQEEEKDIEEVSEEVLGEEEEEKEEGKFLPVPVVEFTPASEELKEKVKEKGIIAALKRQCKKMSEKKDEVVAWVKNNKKKIFAGTMATVMAVGLFAGLRGCEADMPELNNDQVIESVVEDEEIEMPEFDFEAEEKTEEKEEEKEETQDQQKMSLEEVARAVIRGEYGNGAERRERLEAEGYDYDEVQALVNQMLADQNKNETPGEKEETPEEKPEDNTGDDKGDDKEEEKEETPEEKPEDNTGDDKEDDKEEEKEETPEEKPEDNTGDDKEDDKEEEKEETPEEKPEDNTGDDKEEDKEEEKEETPGDGTDGEGERTEPDPEDELIGEEFVPVDPEPVDPEDGEGGENPEEDEKTEEEETPGTEIPGDETDDDFEKEEETDEIILGPGESIQDEGDGYVVNNGEDVEYETGDGVIDVEQDGENVIVTVDPNAGGDASTGTGDSSNPSGITEEEAKEFYDYWGIPYGGETEVEDTFEDTTTEDLVADQEIVGTNNPLEDEKYEIVEDTLDKNDETFELFPGEFTTTPGGELVENNTDHVMDVEADTVTSEVETPVEEATFQFYPGEYAGTSDGGVVENTGTETMTMDDNSGVVEDTVETPVEEESLTDSGITTDEALAFYESLGIPVPENVQENTNGRSR